MSLLDLRTSMQSTLKASVKQLAEVYTHGGNFDLEEVRRYARKAPCIIVGLLGFDSVNYESIPVANVKCAAFVLTKDQPGSSRDAVALTVLQQTLSVIAATQRWGDDLAHMPQSIRGQNLFSGTLDKSGIALWAITWSQGYDIVAINPDDLDDFLKYTSSWSLSSNPDTPQAQDEVDLPGTES